MKRYQVRKIAVGDFSLGRLLFETNNPNRAKTVANYLAPQFYYGTAIWDTTQNTVDWGDKVTSMKGVTFEIEDQQ